jgi:3-hydroxybutyryl-CoA dehydrogenase
MWHNSLFVYYLPCPNPKFNIMNMKKLSVIGAGQMGSGIAQVAAQFAKIPQVVLFDKSQKQLQSQRTKLVEYFEKAKQKGSIGQDEINRTLSSIKSTTELNDLEGSDFIIEVIFNILIFVFYFLF